MHYFGIANNHLRHASIVAQVAAGLRRIKTKKSCGVSVEFSLPARRLYREEQNMQFLLLIYEAEQRFATGYPETEMGEYIAFGEKHAGAIKGTNALQPTSTAKTVRVRNGQTLTTDGPFAETKEQLGGYYLIEANTADEAAAIAAGIPGARYGSIEVRPIMVFS
jgi:hypothetical protein